MKDIMLGRYYERKGIIQTLDPRVKLCFLIFYIAAVFYFPSFSSLLFSSLVLLSLIFISHVPFKELSCGVIRVLAVFLVFAVITVFTVEDGIKVAAVMIIRLILTLYSSLLFASTTKPKDIARGIEKIIGRTIFKRSAHTLSTIVLVAFRFIPILSLEAQRIKEAQESRGVAFNEGSIVVRIRKSMALIIPLFVSAFRKADELALSMDSRLYNKRSAGDMYPLKYTGRDILGYLLIVLYVGVCYIIAGTIWI